ncbi:hypothetical protein [Paucisalibacillus globulus]|nr:hypothetical protein [Paucisalibacillus globulus]
MKTSKEILIEIGYKPEEVKNWTEEECESELSYASEGQDSI